MKVLYKNLLDYGTVTATNENLNYPASNLTYTLLRSRTLLALFKATGSTSTISCALDDLQTVDALAIGNHNLSQLVITLKDSGGSSLGSETFTSASSELSTDYSSTILIELSSSYDNVKTIEVALTTSESYVSIGGLYVGEVLDMDNAEFAPAFNYSLTSTAELTDKGVLSGKEGVNLSSISWNMQGVSKTNLDKYITMFEYCQTNRPLFVNPYSDSSLKQWFGRISSANISAGVLEGGNYDIQIDFEEVR
jgi:hypothetical protein